MKTVSASGAMKLRSPCTMDFAWSSTISTIISTNACMRPGTPAVARRAAVYMTRQPTMPIATDQNSVSMLMMEKSTIFSW